MSLPKWKMIANFPEKTMIRKDFTPPFGAATGIFQFTSKHLERHLLFHQDADYVIGVNSLAIGTVKFPVHLLCYVLMDSHLHLLLEGSFPDCCAYYDWVMLRLARILREQYGLRDILHLGDVDISVVGDPQMLRNEVAYQLRNPYKARVCSPLSYRWSAADVLFREDLDYVRGEPIPGPAEARVLFHTRQHIPSDWEHRSGCLLNKCFVDYRRVQAQFEGSLQLFDLLRKYDLESIVAQSHGLAEQLRFTDSELMERVHILCREEFHVANPRQLDRKSLLRLARSLARRFGASKAQIGRLLGIEGDVLDALL